MSILENEIHAVVNPAGASGAAARSWEKAEQVFRESGRKYTVHFSGEGKGIEDICRELSEAGRPFTLVVVGGDGTLNQAINGIRDFEKVTVGFIPAGSGNDLARDLGFDTDAEKAAHRIAAAAEAATMDLGQVRIHAPARRFDYTLNRPVECGKTEYVDRYFHDACGIGFDAEICELANASKIKRPLNALHLGKLIYIIEAIRLIFSYRKTSFEIRLGNGNVISRDNTLFAVSMVHRYEGGGFCFCPYADAFDDKLDICIANPRYNMSFFRLFPTAYTGKHLRFSCVTSDRSESAVITNTRPLWVQTDGEADYTAERIELRSAPVKLRFIL